MDSQTEYYDHLSHSVHHSTGGDQRSHPSRSPPPQFQEHDKIYTAGNSTQLHSPYPQSCPQSPVSARSPSYHQYEHSPPQGPQGGYFVAPISTEKEIPYATHTTIDTQTPDYSAPEVVPCQDQNYLHTSRPFSPSSNDGSTLMSPQMRPYSFKEHVGPHDTVHRNESIHPPVLPKEHRKCGMKKRTFWILLGFLLAGLVALGVGLGVGLSLNSNKNSNESKTDPICLSNPKLCIGGALNSAYFSQKGAFNGSGIALAGESWSPEAERIFTLYFQHHTGRIRYLQYTKTQEWIGGSEKEIVASDAKDATPISAVSYALNSTQYFHVFYVSKNNTIRQVTLTNHTTTWQPGPLNKLNLQAYDSPSVGLQACWKGNFYGDTDYKGFPTASGDQNDVPYENQVGMNIWYAADNSTFKQYAWYNGNDVWLWSKDWTGFNTQAGVGCFSWGPGTTQYAMMVNKNEDVEFHWKDTNETSTTNSTDSHPINTWVNATSAAIPDVHPATSLGYTDFFFAQSADRSIKGYNMTFSAENTTFSPEETFTVSSPARPVQALGGTHLTVTSYSTRDSKGVSLYENLYVFFQTSGNDITAATRRKLGGVWTIDQLTIPDE